MVSSWFSCSQIDQQHGAQWAESKWELNRLHQGLAVCSLPAWGSKFSQHRAFTDSPLFYSGQLIGSVLFASFFSPSTICLHVFSPALSSVMFFTKAAACGWKLFVLFFYLRLARDWGVLVRAIRVCVCVRARALVNTSRTVKVSSFPL